MEIYDGSVHLDESAKHACYGPGEKEDPVGDYIKQQVREMARSLGLETVDREESQDFIDGGDYSILFTEDEIKNGEIVDEKGQVLGQHRGIIHYTIGQRRGLGIASSKPLYILSIDAEKNRIVVTDRANLFSKGLIAKDLNLISIDRLEVPQKVNAKIRLRHNETPATVFPYGKEIMPSQFQGLPFPSFSLLSWNLWFFSFKNAVKRQSRRPGSLHQLVVK